MLSGHFTHSQTSLEFCKRMFYGSGPKSAPVNSTVPEKYFAILNLPCFFHISKHSVAFHMNKNTKKEMFIVLYVDVKTVPLDVTIGFSLQYFY